MPDCLLAAGQQSPSSALSTLSQITKDWELCCQSPCQQESRLDSAGYSFEIWKAGKKQKPCKSNLKQWQACSRALVDVHLMGASWRLPALVLRVALT